MCTVWGWSCKMFSADVLCVYSYFVPLCSLMSTKVFFCCTITAFCFSFKLRTALLTALLVVVPGSEWGEGVFSNTRSSGFREFADKSCLRAPRLHVAAFLGKRGKLFRSVSRPGVLAVCSLKMYGSLAPTIGQCSSQQRRGGPIT